MMLVTKSLLCPVLGGRPDVLYFNPAAAGATDYKFPLGIRAKILFVPFFKDKHKILEPDLIFPQ